MSELALTGIPVTVTCRVLKLSRQPYYRWLANPVTPSEVVEAYRANTLFDAHQDDAEFGHRLLAEEAAGVIGVAQAVGARWFHNAGGMPPFDLKFTPTGRSLAFTEREEIALLRAEGKGVREIARAIGRDPGTISRELRRNAAVRYGSSGYRASVAQWKADMAAKRPKVAKLVANPQLHAYIQERLAGQISTPNGTLIPGPTPPRFIGRNKPHRKDRPWTLAWSPEQIAHRLKVDFPEDETMRISHEAIYQSLYIQGRGALKRELVWCLRTGRALRAPRERSRRKTWAHVTPETLISERPSEVEDRAIPGHWEGDLLIGLERSAIGTVVERKTRLTLLVHLPREEGYRTQGDTEERPGAGRLWRDHDEERPRDHDVDTAGAAGTVADLGPREGDVGARAVPSRDRDPGLLRRPAIAVAAGHEREHQRAAASVLP